MSTLDGWLSLDQHYKDPENCGWCKRVAPNCWLNKSGNGHGGYMHDANEMAADCAAMRGDERCEMHGWGWVCRTCGSTATTEITTDGPPEQSMTVCASCGND